jgi:hypothetical protein
MKILLQPYRPLGLDMQNFSVEKGYENGKIIVKLLVN